MGTRQHIARWRGQVESQTLLSEIAANPDRRLGRIPILTTAEKRETLRLLQGRETPYPADGAIHELIEAQVGRTSEAAALCFENRTLSYAVLAARSARLAAHLRGRGVGPEVLVGVCAERSLEMVIGILAVLKAGAAYVPLDPEYPDERIAFMIADAAFPVVLGQSAYLARLSALGAETVCLNAPVSARRPAVLPSVTGAFPAYMIYTSGSTGQPKGVTNTHGGILNRLLWMVRDYHMGPADRVLQKTAFSFDVSLWEFFCPLLSGACLTLARPGGHRDPAYLVDIIAKQRISMIHFAPSMLQVFLEEPGLDRLNSMRQVFSSGEALSRTISDRFFEQLPNVALDNLYGPTEAAIEATRQACRPARGQGGVPIGKPIVNTRIYILDPELAPVPIGTPGELYIGGVGLARGYHRRPELTAARFIPNPFAENDHVLRAFAAGARLYRTGDLARVHEDGAIAFLGRLDHQIKIRGFRIELGEIEACLNRHAKVRDALVVFGDQRLTAYLVVADPDGPHAAALLDELRLDLAAKLPAYMLPSAFVLLSAFPLTPSGKVDREALPGPGRSDQAAAFVPPRTAAEIALAGIWQELLRLDRVGVHDNFFEQGGDSILALQVVARARVAGLNLMPRDLVRRQTIAELALVSSPRVERERAVVAGPVPLTPIQHWFLGREPEAPHHFNQALLLETPADLNPAMLAAALKGLSDHHDALRLRFTLKNSEWTQRHAEPGQCEAPLAVVDASALARSSRNAALKRVVARNQTGLNLEIGSLVRAVWFYRGQAEPAALHLVIHHLVVDGVSWRVLLEDLETAYRLIAAAKPVRLPPKTTAFQQYAERLTELARSKQIISELSDWQTQDFDAPPLPLDFPDGRAENRVAAAEQETVSLDPDRTRALLRDISHRSLRIDHVLLTALSHCLAEWTGETRFLIDLEHHGRDTPFDDIDLSRTVGWFTAIYPVCLRLDPATDLIESLDAIKRQMNRTPAHGLGHGLLRYLSPDPEIRQKLAASPRAEISFNYLGQWDQVWRQPSLFRAAKGDAGPSRGAKQRRPYLFEIDGLVSENRLSLSWTYCAKAHRRATVRALARAFLTSLERLIDQIPTASANLAASSNDAAQLDPADLEKIVALGGPVEDYYLLSPTQQGILFHTRSDPGSGLYIEQLNAMLHGPLEPMAFQRAWQAVVAHLPVLRTAFPRFDWETPRQVVFQRVELPFQYLDWRALSSSEQETELQAFLTADRAKGFRLDRPPLMRFALMRLEKERHRLVWSHHHVLLDGWCLPLILKHVFHGYRAFVLGEKPKLAPSPPYRNYIDWLHDRDHERAAAFWRQALAGYATPVVIGSGLSARHNFRVVDMREHEQSLSETATDALTAMARRCHVSLNALIQAAWSLLLSRYSGRRDLVFATTVAGRPASLAGVETMVGLFINTLPVRVRIPDGANVRDFARTLLQAQLEREQFADTPLFEIRRCCEVPPELPLFESLLVFESYPIDASLKSRSAGLELGEVRLIERTNDPLGLIIVPGPALRLRFNYDRDRFEPAAIARIMRHFMNLLKAISLNPETSIDLLPMMDQQERQTLLHELNDTASSFLGEERFVRLVEDHARTRPDMLALVQAESGGDRHMSYGALNHRARGLAARLQKRGPGRETPIGLCADRSLEAVAGVLAIFMVNGAYLPLDPAHPRERLAVMLADADAGLVLTDRANRERLPEPWREAALLLEENGVGERFAPSRSSPSESLAYLIFTSGSTGKPKGVALTHRGLWNMLHAQLRVFGTCAEDRVLQFASPGFDAAISELCVTLAAGATLTLAEKAALFPGLALAGFLAERAVTMATLPPSALAVTPVESLPRLRALIVAGEACPRDLVEKWGPGRIFINAYGPTEATVCASAGACILDRDAPDIGYPIANTRIHVIDGSLQLAPFGVAGELAIAGRGLARCYVQRPDLTAEKFTPDPFSQKPGRRLYKTGDLVLRRENGRLEFLGRLDSQVKIRGFRIEPGEIESLLRRCPTVRNAVVVVRPDRSGDPCLVAHLIAAPGARDETMREFLGAHLPEYMIPAHFVFTDILPITANGKIDRAALGLPERARSETGELNRELPANRLEIELGRIWGEVLGLERVPRAANFFELGGHSLHMARVQTKLKAELGHDLKMVTLFQHTSIAALGRYLNSTVDAPEPSRFERIDPTSSSDIAVIGFAGRFPGAADIDQFWRNLCQGVESITALSEEALRAVGEAPELFQRPDYVKVASFIDGFDQFDASFFNITPREAETMDPQHRLFLEEAWHALEHAGYDPETKGLEIGLFAGSGANGYLLRNILTNPGLMDAVGGYQTLLRNEGGFLPTRVSYKLNLKGPSVFVQTACSTSLVAVHMACRNLIDRTCGLALAGGVSIDPQPRGYLFQEGMILSPDGHCRVFDAAAGGTVTASGLGVVVLKRLEDAIADRDSIHAIIKATAINNDGADKAGFTAPSVQGQRAVIRDALVRAGIAPETIGYVEAHGTGTPLGDPIEIEALRQAYQTRNPAKPCLIGSVKSNIGHADTAAGVAGLIKTVLALKHRRIPASLHFNTANPELEFGDRFRVNAQLTEWKRDPADPPRRAGVSSFGIGGTNAHAVLEQAPDPEPDGPARAHQILILSARGETALNNARRNLADHLEREPQTNLADMAYTLQVGRRAFSYRRAFAFRNRDEALTALRSEARSIELGETPPSVAFLFPGQGAQYAGMAAGLYRDEPVFREQVDRAADFLQQSGHGHDLRAILFSSEPERAVLLDQTEITQPALFVVEYACARLWLSWGVAPRAMAGHSIGEYVAAVLAGVFSFEDGLSLVQARGHLMSRVAAGAMLAALASESEIQGFLTQDISLAANNGPGQCVVSGSIPAIDELEGVLGAEGVVSRRLRTSHAFHSVMMDPILEEFESEVRRVALHPPRIPFLSNLTGTWITEAEAVDPSYWTRHLRGTVRFDQNLETLMAEPSRVLVEVGPGRTLTGLVRRRAREASGIRCFASMRGGQDSGSDQAVMLEALAELWLRGVDVDWSGFSGHERRRRIPLPGYAFDRQRYWIEPGRANALSPPAAKDIADWCYLPSWKRVARPPAAAPRLGVRYLLFLDSLGLGARLAKLLRASGVIVTTVRTGTRFRRSSERAFTLNPNRAKHFDRLFRGLAATDRLPTEIVILWSVTPELEPDVGKNLERALDNGFFNVLLLVRSLAAWSAPEPFLITFVSNHRFRVIGDEALDPGKAVVQGPLATIPMEYDNILCRALDLATSADNPDLSAEELVLELETPFTLGDPNQIALRRGQRWVPIHEPVRLAQPSQSRSRLKRKGVYLITGGFGGIGYTLATFLAREYRARLVLIGRSGERPGQIQSLEALGAEVLPLRADVCDYDQMRAVLTRVHERFGPINGAIHAAGIPGDGAIDLKTPQKACAVLAPKIHGALMLYRLLSDAPLDFMLLCSSLAAVLPRFGQVDYAAANAFLDAFAQKYAEPFTVAVNWDAWSESGMAVAANRKSEAARMGPPRASAQETGIRDAEGADLFARILGHNAPRIIVSLRHPDPRAADTGLDRLGSTPDRLKNAEHTSAAPSLPREPDSGPDAPKTETERDLAQIWRDCLGIERIGVHDEFLALGGLDSLLAAQIFATGLRERIQTRSSGRREKDRARAPAPRPDRGFDHRPARAPHQERIERSPGCRRGIGRVRAGRKTGDSLESSPAGLVNRRR